MLFLRNTFESLPASFRFSSLISSLLFWVQFFYPGAPLTTHWCASELIARNTGKNYVWSKQCVNSWCLSCTLFPICFPWHSITSFPFISEKLQQNTALSWLEPPKAERRQPRDMEHTVSTALFLCILVRLDPSTALLGFSACRTITPAMHTATSPPHPAWDSSPTHQHNSPGTLSIVLLGKSAALCSERLQHSLIRTYLEIAFSSAPADWHSLSCTHNINHPINHL